MDAKDQHSFQDGTGTTTVPVQLKQYQDLEGILTDLKGFEPNDVPTGGFEAVKPYIALGALVGYMNCNPDDTRAQQELGRVWQPISHALGIAEGAEVGAGASAR